MSRLTANDADLRRAFGHFDHYLNGSADQPVGVAVSGGGDSVALLYWLAEWKKRPLEVFCVDHGLNPHSTAWADSVARHAAAVGAGFTALTWHGDKPSTGISAAARAARHALLADAARQKGVRVLCLAHTRDDLAEAALMRDEGSNVGAPRPWSPSPAWPQGRGVFLLRPLLDQRREALRQWLRERALTWIDDPANDSAASLRARARKTLQNKDITSLAAPDDPIDLTGLLAKADTLGALGQIVFDAANFHARPRPQALRLLAAATVSAGGGNRLPRRDRLENLYDALKTGRPLTLAGARIVQADGLIQIGREAGDIGRHADASVNVVAGEERVWDGRFVLTSSEPGMVHPARGRRGRLPDRDQVRLNGLPRGLRDTLPVFEDRHKMLALPGVFQALVLPRFLCACGAASTERDLQDLYAGGPKGL